MKPVFITILALAAHGFIGAADGGVPTPEALIISQRDAIVAAGNIQVTYDMKSYRDGVPDDRRTEESAMLAANGNFMFTEKRFEIRKANKATPDKITSFWCSAYVDGSSYWYQKSGALGGVVRTSNLPPVGRKFARKQLVDSAVITGMDQTVLMSPSVMAFDVPAIYDRHFANYVGANPRWCDMFDTELIAKVASLFEVVELKAGSTVALKFTAEAMKKFPNNYYEYQYEAVKESGGTSFWRMTKAMRSPYWNKPYVAVAMNSAWLMSNFELYEYSYTPGEFKNKQLVAVMPTSIAITSVYGDSKQQSISAELKSIKTFDPQDLSETMQELILSASEVSTLPK